MLKEYGFNATVFLTTNYCERLNNWPGQPAFIKAQPLLSWMDIKEMSRSGIQFGAHTHNHPSLTKIPIKDAENEILLSKKIIGFAIYQEWPNCINVIAMCLPHTTKEENLCYMLKARKLVSNKPVVWFDENRMKLQGIIKGEEKIFLPIRCAKIIHDAFEMRRSDKKDILHYSKCKEDNFDYEVFVHMMDVKYGNCLKEYFEKKIPKFTKEEFKELEK